MKWLRRRGDRVKITTGKYAGHQGTVESNVFQRTVDYPDEYTNGYHVMLDKQLRPDPTGWRQLGPFNVCNLYVKLR